MQQHLQMPNYLIHQESLLLLKVSVYFKSIALSGTELIVNKDKAKITLTRPKPLSSFQGTALTCQAVLLIQQGHYTHTSILTGLAHPDTELLPMLLPSVLSSLEDTKRLLRQKFCGGWSC